MAESKAESRKIQDKPGASCGAKKEVINNKNRCKDFRETGSNLKKPPMSKVGIM